MHVSGYKVLKATCKYSSRFFEFVEIGVKSMISFSSLSHFAICFSVTSCNDVLEVMKTRNDWIVLRPDKNADSLL
jgi:hypothetical protein